MGGVLSQFLDGINQQRTQEKIMISKQKIEWHSEKSLANCTRYMLDNEISTDVCFTVGPPDGDIEHIRAHKFMLIARSPVFEAMFSSGMSECIGPVAKVRIEDIDADIFKELLNYIYCGNVSEGVLPESAIYLMYAARKYMLSKLERECVNSVLERLEASNVIQFLEQSFYFDHHELRNEILKHISVNATAVLTGVEILSASRQVMEAILEEETMLVSELVIYKTAVNWAKHQLQRSTPGNQPTDLEIRKKLGDLLYKIRFPAMNPDEFAKLSAESDLLTDTEKDLISRQMASSKDIQLMFPTERRTAGEDWVDLTVECVQGRWWSTPTVDLINFKTDVNILLTGFSLYTGDNERGYVVEVEILQSLDSLFKQSFTVPYTGSPTPYKIALDVPIVIPAEVRFSVKALSRQFISCYDELRKVSCAKERVNFTFLKHKNSPFTTERHGHVPRLYFRYL